jgi:hypothetical protein
LKLPYLILRQMIYFPQNNPIAESSGDQNVEDTGF